MKSRYLIGGALVLVLIGILALAYAFLSATTGNAPSNPGQASSTNPFGFPTGGGNGGVSAATREIAAGEATLTVPDFTSGRPSVSVGTAASDVQYDLTPYADYEPGKPYPTHAYDVQFNERGSQFIVTLNEEPLGASRLSAEAFLRATLELRDDQLCSLDVIVGVPHSVNPTYSSYQNLGLSSCTGSLPLPS